MDRRSLPFFPLVQGAVLQVALFVAMLSPSPGMAAADGRDEASRWEVPGDLAFVIWRDSPMIEELRMELGLNDSQMESLLAYRDAAFALSRIHSHFKDSEEAEALREDTLVKARAALGKKGRALPGGNEEDLKRRFLAEWPNRCAARAKTRVDAEIRLPAGSDAAVRKPNRYREALTPALAELLEARAEMAFGGQWPAPELLERASEARRRTLMIRRAQLNPRQLQLLGEGE